MAEKETDRTPGTERPTLKPQSPDPDWDLPSLRMDHIEEGGVRTPATITQKNDKSLVEEK